MINMIFNRDSSGKNCLMRKKVHSRHVFKVGTSKLSPHQPITFIPEDGKEVLYLYNDAMAIMMDIDEFIIKRILVDSGSPCNVLT